MQDVYARRLFIAVLGLLILSCLLFALTQSS